MQKQVVLTEEEWSDIQKRLSKLEMYESCKYNEANYISDLGVTKITTSENVNISETQLSLCSAKLKPNSIIIIHKK